MSFSFRPAKREQVGLLIGLAGASGSGKSYTANRIATGLADGHPYAVIDTEAGRAKHYADVFKFDHGDLTPPFSPEHYVEAILAAEAAGYPVIVVDSMSHEHAGDGGLLDMQEAELTRMAGDDWRKREACRMASWIRPKTSHKRMVSRLLQVRAHLVLCFRAEERIEMKKGADGRMEIVPKASLTGLHGWIPVCEKTLPYELTASFLLTPDKPGFPKPIKLQEQHKPFFPLDQPISEASGQRLAAWAKGSTPAPTGLESGIAPQGDAKGRIPSHTLPPAAREKVATAITADLDLDILISDFCARFDEASSGEEGKGWSERWDAAKVTHKIEPAQAAPVEAARQRARQRLKGGTR